MSDLPAPEPVALLVSDVHLSEARPSCRAEPDWLGVMAGYLGQLKALQRLFGNVPILCGGDLFHVPQPSPRLINFALDHLPPLIAVPGQHDLLNHVYDDLDATAYGVLVKCGLVIDLKPGKPHAIEGAVLHGFPWGFDPEPAPRERPCLGIRVAVCHRYVFDEQSGHPGADPAKHVGRTQMLLGGYDCALFGDNHKAVRGGVVFNPGTFLRRRQDDVPHRPRVGVLLSDGTVKAKYLDCSADRFVAAKEKATPQADVAVARELEGLAAECVDFAEMVRRDAESPGVGEGARGLMKESVSA